MSHFTVTVRVTAERLEKHGGDLDAALAEMMAPYEESPEEGSPFLVFESEEEEARKEYEEETVEVYRLPNGRIVGKYDHEADTLGLKDTIPLVEVPFKERYKTFDEFARDYHGYRLDPKSGHYGCWRNPNAKWDWWVIGGRWTGYYPLKAGRRARLGRPGAGDNKPEPGHGDVVRVDDIDIEKVERAAEERREKFWREWQLFLESGGKLTGDTPWSGPRSTALDIGLLDVVRGPAEPTPTTRVLPWKDKPRVDDDRRDWNDVAVLVTKDEFLRDYGIYFDELATYAALDDEGWHQPGQMGWWACTDATPESRRAYLKEFRPRIIDACGPDDLLVVTDCHI